jgi:transcriptional regulator with XRE-family HTH domain
MWVRYAHMVAVVNMKTDKLTGAQIRAARALKRWSAADLARASALGVNTVRRAEAADIETSLTTANELAIRRAFEAVGVEFTDGDQPGLRFSKIAAVRADESADSSKMTVRAKIGRNTTKPTTKKR